MKLSVALLCLALGKSVLCMTTVCDIYFRLKTLWEGSFFFIFYFFLIVFCCCFLLSFFCFVCFFVFRLFVFWWRCLFLPYILGAHNYVRNLIALRVRVINLESFYTFWGHFWPRQIFLKCKDVLVIMGVISFTLLKFSFVILRVS